MKRLFYLVAIIAFGAFVSSCSNDDDNGATATNPIIGNWEISEVNFNLQEDGVVTFDQAFSTDVCNAPLIFSFGSDGDFSISNADLELDFDFDGNANLICSVGDGTLPGSWERISGNNYLLTSENEPSQAEISLSNNNNSIEIILVNEDYDEIDDITYTDTITFTGVRN